MPTHPIVHHAATGQVVNVTLFDDNDSAVITETMAEAPGASGRYVVTNAQLAAVAAGGYDYSIVVGATLEAQGRFDWNGAERAEGYFDSRDFQIVGHVWKPQSAGDPLVRCPGVLRLAPGAQQTAEFDLADSAFLPNDANVGTVTFSVSGDADITVAKLGIDEDSVKCTVTASGSAIENDSAWIIASVTDSNGNGPRILSGQVEIDATTS